jgi:hypothetical protein
MGPAARRVWMLRVPEIASVQVMPHVCTRGAGPALPWPSNVVNSGQPRSQARQGDGRQKDTSRPTSDVVEIAEGSWGPLVNRWLR